MTETEPAAQPIPDDLAYFFGGPEDGTRRPTDRGQQLFSATSLPLFPKSWQDPMPQTVTVHRYRKAVQGHGVSIWLSDDATLADVVTRLLRGPWPDAPGWRQLYTAAMELQHNGIGLEPRCKEVAGWLKSLAMRMRDDEMKERT